MQYSQQPSFPPLFPSFKKHRPSIDHSRFNLNLILPVPPSPPVWASLPTPPMSGSPPPEQPSSPKQLAGQRRKRSDSPPPTTTASASLPATLAHGPTTYRQPPFPELQASYQQQHQQHQQQQQQQHPAPYPAPFPGHQSMAYVAGPVAAPVPSPPGIRYQGQQLSPQATRKNKAHVASACVNCKKKHLRCDNARPCRRCVQSGKEVSHLIFVMPDLESNV